jgi:peptidoglycan hydrolase-like amidase
MIIIAGKSLADSKDSNPEKKYNNPLIRVLLINSISSFDILTHDSWSVQNLKGESTIKLDKESSATIALKDGNVVLKIGDKYYSAKGLVLESASPHGILEIKKVPYGVGWWWAGTQDRTYEGRFEIRPLEKGVLEVIVILPMENYLFGVVPSEIGASSPKEALCAQAVAARSEALMALSTGKYAGAHHDIGSDVESQAFTGKTKGTPESDEAVMATRGLALIHDGKPIAAYYASSCGGHTDDIRNVWPHRAGEKAYWGAAFFDGEKTFDLDLTKDEDLRKWLDDDPDVYCNPKKYKVPDWASKNFRWEREIGAEELTKRVALNKDIGRITGLKAISRGPSGRMIEAEFIGEKGTWKTGPELAIRQVFDPPLKSAAFVVDTRGTENRPEKFILRGAGWGHGVGMCQTGAIAMAHAGKTFHEILSHYYPSSKIEAMY